MRVLAIAAALMLCVGSAFASGYTDFNAGIDAHNHDNADAAIGYFTSAIAAPDLPRTFLPVAYFDRGDAHFSRKEFELALADYSTCITLDPGYLEAYLRRGFLLLQNDKFESARADFDEVVRRKPFLPLGYMARASTAVSVEHFDAALGDVSQAISLDPQSGDGYVMRSKIYRQQGNDDAAIADADKAVDRDEKDADAYFARGDAYHDSGKLDQAKRDFEKGLTLQPDNDDNRLTLGLIEWEKGDFEEAAASFSQYQQRQPQDPYGLLWLAIVASHTQDAHADLAQLAKGLDLSKWPGPLIALYIGKATPDAAQKGAQSGDPKEAAGRNCEAAFYAGEWQLVHSEKSEAKTLLQNAATTCPHDFVEFSAASAELGRIR